MCGRCPTDRRYTYMCTSVRIKWRAATMQTSVVISAAVRAIVATAACIVLLLLAGTSWCIITWWRACRRRVYRFPALALAMVTQRAAATAGGRAEGFPTVARVQLRPAVYIIARAPRWPPIVIYRRPRSETWTRGLPPKTNPVRIVYTTGKLPRAARLQRRKNEQQEQQWQRCWWQVVSGATWKDHRPLIYVFAIVILLR